MIQENQVKLRLNIVDTPGFGDLVNNEGCWEPIIKYIKDQHSAYLRKELTALRGPIQDTRIHCCLYFIAPTGHSLKQLDIIVMKKLSEVVNVIPIIAKADSLTLEERDLFKQRIRAELAHNAIRIYPYDSDELDDQELQLNAHIHVRRPAFAGLIGQDMIPFAIVGSERVINVNGQTVRGRKTRWGVVNIENEQVRRCSAAPLTAQHTDFNYLRNHLMRTHLQDLIDTTASQHYESFRSRQLLALKVRCAHGGAADQAGRVQAARGAGQPADQRRRVVVQSSLIPLPVHTSPCTRRAPSKDRAVKSVH